MKNKIFFFYLFIYFFIVSLYSCKSTKDLEREEEQPQAFQNLFLGNEEYIFIRIYDPSYNNPLYVANLLKKGIELTEVNGVYGSHSAINFDLTDSFIGLTQFSKPQLKAERCTQVDKNEYMNACNPRKSQQRTYALKVTPEECRKAKEIIKAHSHIRYDTMQNFYFASYSVRRKFFTSEEDRSLKKQKQNISGLKTKTGIFQKDFVCSTFIAYILKNSVASMHDYMIENEIDYNYIGVTDLTQLPGMEFLFSSSWSNYHESARDFVSTDNRFYFYFDW